MRLAPLTARVVVVAVGVFGCLAVPAFAAPRAPETPEVVVEEFVPANGAVVHGVLDPGKRGEPGTYELGTYQFLYKASKTKACEGGSTAPTSPAISLGAGEEPVSEALPALSPGTEYAVCLDFETAGGIAVSAPVTFTAAIAPQTPETNSAATSVTATAAVLEGTLNPTTAAETGWHFLYSTQPTCAAGATETPPVAVTKVAANTKVHLEVKELQPNAKYTFCLVASNAAGETAQSTSEGTFETKAAAPTVDGETTSRVHSTSATLEAAVNANNEKAGYLFEYATNEALTGATKLPGAPPKPELEHFGNQDVAIPTGAVLAPGTTYFYRAVASNATPPTTDGAIESFTTPPAPRTQPASAITASTATLNGELTPINENTATEYSFDYNTGGECSSEEGKEEASTAPVSVGKGSGTKTVSSELTGLLPNTQYTVCLLSSNAFGSELSPLTPPVRFTTLVAALSVEAESASGLQATEARLEARINPGNSETAYHFEYGLAAGSYEASVPIPDAEIHASLTGVSVGAVATHLTPGTTYHYRVVAANALPGAVDGADQTFTTPAAQGTGSPAACPNEQLRAEQPYGLDLPDCRAYEMVSPLEKNGNDATDPERNVSRASLSGEALIFTAGGSFANPAGSQGNNQFLARRSPEGWSTQSITPPFAAYGTTGYTYPYESLIFTPELTEGVANTDVALPGTEAPAGLYELYLADFATGSYRWLSTPPTAQEPYRPLEDDFAEGASTDLSHVVFDEYLQGSLYEWFGGEVTRVGVSNDEDAMSAAVGRERDVRNAVSSDGSRVYFTSGGQLFVRVNIDQPHVGKEQSKLNAKEECTESAKACTVEVDAAEEGAPGPGGGGQFWGASADGERVFFTDENKLTKDSTAESGDPDLYEYDIEQGHPYGHLTDLTVAEAGDDADVQGVVQISEEGQYVYFVAKGALAPRATAQTCTGSGPGEGCNLYVSHEGGEPVFIATLAAGDAADWQQSGYEVDDAAVSADGSRLAFVSEASLTGYDNEPAEDSVAECGSRCREVYMYDASAGSLTCVSCNPTGAQPIGPSSLGEGDGERDAGYVRRNFSEDGSRLFFQSFDALVAHDSNGRQDVYEYEDGHVYPISDVAGRYESIFLDASANGNDVFIGTADQLVAEDDSDNVEVYDARVGGGFSESAAAPACDNADSCKPPPAPQPAVFGEPSSATFSGPGTLASLSSPAVVRPKPKLLTRAQKLAKALTGCAKDKKKSKRAKCQKQAKQKYGASKAKKAKKATTNRRAH